MLKWLIIGLFAFSCGVILLFVIMHFLGGGIGGGYIVKNDMTYKDFKNSELYSGSIVLPQTTEGIDVFLWLGFDTNYRFVQANVGLENNLTAFVEGMEEGLDIDLKIEDVNFCMSTFDKIFSKKHKPQWWNEESMLGFVQNCMLVRPYENHYGRGMWYFYNRENRVIKVFEWNQQWLSTNRLKEGIITEVKQEIISSKKE